MAVSSTRVDRYSLAVLNWAYGGTGFAVLTPRMAVLSSRVVQMSAATFAPHLLVRPVFRMQCAYLWMQCFHKLLLSLNAVLSFMDVLGASLRMQAVAPEFMGAMPPNMGAMPPNMDAALP
eukprot:3942002-Rhodomonas_salina.3